MIYLHKFCGYIQVRGARAGDKGAKLSPCASTLGRLRLLGPTWLGSLAVVLFPVQKQFSYFSFYFPRELRIFVFMKPTTLKTETGIGHFINLVVQINHKNMSM